METGRATVSINYSYVCFYFDFVSCIFCFEHNLIWVFCDNILHFFSLICYISERHVDLLKVGVES